MKITIDSKNIENETAREMFEGFCKRHQAGDFSSGAVSQDEVLAMLIAAGMNSFVEFCEAKDKDGGVGNLTDFLNKEGSK